MSLSFCNKFLVFLYCFLKEIVLNFKMSHGSVFMSLQILFVYVGAFLIIIGFIYLCNAICKRRKHADDDNGVPKTPVVVTSTTHTAPGGYPVTQLPPHAQVYQSTGVYAAPYPTQATVTAMPMPSHQPTGPGINAYVTPYPPAHNAMMNPPSYDAAVNSPSQPPNVTNNYEKQQPYNPSFTAH